MERRILVVGDPPAPGGQVLPYDGPMFDLYGYRVALVGSRAYCKGCNSVGIIAKAGGPRRPQFISEAALEGDVVVCHCPVPQPILSTLQQTATCDDGAWYAVGTQPSLAAMAMTTTATHAGEMAALKKAVDEGVKHPPEAEETEKMCPSMTNKEFCTLILALRDRAVALISKKRLPELDRWDKGAQDRVKEWFGVADQPMRDYLQKGLIACKRVLESLGCANFVRYSDIAKKNLSCVFPSQTSGTIAAVCKPDTATRTIAIALAFCNLREYSAESDSKLLTLIHEVTHFDDCFGSFDTIYKMKESLKAVTSRSSDVKANADNIAGYVVWGESHVD
jgi:hypothetical protein